MGWDSEDAEEAYGDYLADLDNSTEALIRKGVRHVGIKFVECKYCDQGGLLWGKTDDGWRLWLGATIHDCVPYEEEMPANHMTFKARSQQAELDKLQSDLHLWYINRDGNPEMSKVRAYTIMTEHWDTIAKIFDFSWDGSPIKMVDDDEIDKLNLQVGKLQDENDALRKDNVRLSDTVDEVVKKMDLTAHWLETAVKAMRKTVDSNN